MLLIGIDVYDGGGSLNGCVNDIVAIERLLTQRVGIAADRVTKLASARDGDTDAATLPTLANIRAALARLGDREIVGRDDRVLIYYSGHGTQCIVTDTTKRRFAREALLPKDKVNNGVRQFLFDWELNQAIAKIVACAPRTTVILDSCSAGGATRGPFATSPSDRFFATPDPVQVNHEIGAGSRGIVWSLGSVEECQVIAACRDDQRARESAGADGVHHGELTRALLAQLSMLTDAELERVYWSRIWRGVDTAVRTANPSQAPWLFGRYGRRLFSFDTDEEGDVGYAIVQVPAGFELDVGALHGVTDDAEINVYGATPVTFAPLNSPNDKPVGRIRITQTWPERSVGTPVVPFALPVAPRGRLAVAGREAALRVQLDTADLTMLAAIQRSKLVEVVSDAAEVLLVKRHDGWVVTDDLHDAEPGGPQLAVIPHNSPDPSRVLEHYLAYLAPLRMARACWDLPGALAISVLDCNGALLDPSVAQLGALPSVRDLRVNDRVCFAVDNTASMPLSVTLLDCAASGRVLLLGEAVIPANGRYVAWDGATLGKPFVAGIPTDRRVGIDRLVAIGTTNPAVKLHVLQRGIGFQDLTVRGNRALSQQIDSHRSKQPLAQWTSATRSVCITR